MANKKKAPGFKEILGMPTKKPALFSFLGGAVLAGIAWQSASASEHASYVNNLHYVAIDTDRRQAEQAAARGGYKAAYEGYHKADTVESDLAADANTATQHDAFGAATASTLALLLEAGAVSITLEGKSKRK